MKEQNNGLLLVQNDLKKIVTLCEKCINAGVDDETIYATVYSDDIQKFLMGKRIKTIIIDSEMYNIKTAAIIKAYATGSNLKVILVTNNFSKKTIRMMMDENLKYINFEISSNDLSRVLEVKETFKFKKVVHL